jgi:hypothetical protein
LESEKEFTMRHLPVRFAKIALLELLTYAALPSSYAQTQEINQPRVIGDAKLAGCVNRLGQNMVRDGIAKVPFTIKIEVSGVAASDRQAKIVSDPATAACIDLLAQNLMRNGTGKVPFVIRVTPGR